MERQQYNLIQLTGRVCCEQLDSGPGYRFTGSELIKLDWMERVGLGWYI